MTTSEKGFTLIELVAVIIVVGIISVFLFSRVGLSINSNLQTSRDDIIAALFFAQQTAMARDNIQLSITANTINVTENGNPIRIHSDAYPLTLPSGVSVTAVPSTYSYDKLGKTTPGSITVSRDGVSATITVEASGYAHY
ncbi:prepilin-type N-terminal cleavage/methylation domain-containing protein [Cellvibrio sp. ARAG 10.3]|uniref:prepilin-type N-terminal cleavage/methylation domain-containing protein n=1 Tax=Cellvibrio sp. ARAG 10.3 TaxID=3451358 RepID=UPI003F4592DD